LKSLQTYPLSRYALQKSDFNPADDYAVIRTARLLASRLGSEFPLSPGEISALGLQGKIYLHLIEKFQRTVRPALFSELNERLTDDLGFSTYEMLISRSLRVFPTEEVYQQPEQIQGYRSQDPQLRAYRFAYLKSLLLIILAAENPALTPDQSVFRQPDLTASSEFTRLISSLNDFFEEQPAMPATSQSLLELLRTPHKHSPHSINEQLEFILRNWQALLDGGLYQELLRSLDAIKEERKPGFQGPGVPLLPDYSPASYLEEENAGFSEDKDWMPRAVLIAKNVFVWLDQLSRKYQRSISRLDEIPSEELETLARWGINSLWLIGLWERSPASQRIKQLCGNPDAIPSAYSLYDYVIADILGGDSAYRQLVERARTYGIRLAADMVPNHVGIVSDWVYEYPDWFLSREDSPYPAYSFQGPDLAERHQMGIFLEDHYYTKTDAAVVFKRVDYQRGETRYIYHGNDGTAMPWNDTAQLNYLRPDVREAVLETIIKVAKKFSIIRFDAAMTLTKKHYQRLWFPQPGTGGAIPTRSEHSLTKKEFDQMMPQEFWREVVDRIAEEAPDTLLLAEAFWMMEGFFVRSLGMHRVYNSAFMHMLRDEKNAQYRELILKTLSFDPEILKRYVNFMNNPDEETAVAQFGKGGKYFGICTLMATLPGLPMFGHGQIEGYTEKYGMEYQRAYYKEFPDQQLVARHQREIFPLLHRRYLFADVKNFHFYDFIASGEGNEDVFAYSNRVGEEFALVVYHNRWGEARGSIHRACGGNQAPASLYSLMPVNGEENSYLLFRDHVTGMEYIRSAQEIKESGLYLEMGAYSYHVFWQFLEVRDDSGLYQQLHRRLNGRGVSDLEEKLRELQLQPLVSFLVNLLESKIAALEDQQPPWVEDAGTTALLPDSAREEEQSDLHSFYARTASVLVKDLSQEKIETSFRLFPLIRSLPALWKGGRDAEMIFSVLSLSFWILLQPILDLEKRVFSDLIHFTLQAVKNQEWFPTSNEIIVQSDRVISAVELLQSQGQESLSDFIIRDETIVQTVQDWFSANRSRAFLQVHSYQTVEWFNKEAFQQLVHLFISSSMLLQMARTDHKLRKLSSMARNSYRKLEEGMEESEYRVEKFLTILSKISSR